MLTNLSNLDRYLLKRIFTKAVVQGNHAGNMTEIYSILREAAIKQFPEEPLMSLEMFLAERFLKSCTMLEEDDEDPTTDFILNSFLENPEIDTIKIEMK